MKVGNEVRVIGNSCYHNFRIGEIIEITSVEIDSGDGEEYYGAVGAIGNFWWIRSADIEELK